MENITPKILERLREEKGWSKTAVAKRLGIKTVSTYANWEYGLRAPDKDMLAQIAELYGVTTDYLITGEDYKSKVSQKDADLPELTAKDERNILKDLEKIINNLENKDGLANFDGHTLEDMDEEDRELLIASLENSMRLAKRMAKQKYTPKKYRDD